MRALAGIALAILALSGCASSSVPLHAQSLTLQSENGAPTRVEELTRGRDATVLVFWSSGCPCVRRYQQRVDALLDRYPSDRVRVVGISSNAGESFDLVLQTARERGVRIPIYRDEGGQLARAVGARTTPTVAVIDRQGRVSFLGWLDNERLPGDPDREAWLESAVTGVLEGRDFQPRTPVYGCALTRSLFQSSSPSCCTQPQSTRRSQ